MDYSQVARSLPKMRRDEGWQQKYLKTSYGWNRFCKWLVESAVGWLQWYRDTENNVQYILHNDLKKRKLCSHFILHTLTIEQQQVSHTEDLLEMIENNPDFVDSIITGNESWCFAYDSKKVAKHGLGWSKITTCEKTLLPKIENQNNAYPVFRL